MESTPCKHNIVNQRGAMNSNGQEDGGKQRETGDLVERKAGFWKGVRGSDKPQRMRAASISSRAPRPEHRKQK